MPLRLTDIEKSWLTDDTNPGRQVAMRIVAQTAEFLGAQSLVEITSAHIDGCLYHGDGGVQFAEKLVEGGARIAVPASLNVGSLDRQDPQLVKGGTHHRVMAGRLMKAYLALGCAPTWTCAPYQAGHRPSLGAQVAWGESNAVAFVNSVLGARSERYGDFLDICCAIVGRAPLTGLHLTENRRAELVIDCSRLSPALRDVDAFYPVLGAIVGREAGTAIAVLTGLARTVSEDRLKALGAGAASAGAVGLFHVVGVTPEAATLGEAAQGELPVDQLMLTTDMVRAARDGLSNAVGDRLDCVALGSPHFSADEVASLASLSSGIRFQIPVYVCTGRHVMDQIDKSGLRRLLEDCGVTFVVDTCVVVTPILKQIDGVMMTNSAKFAYYARPNTGHHAVFGSLPDCVASAAAGRVVRDESLWQ